MAGMSIVIARCPEWNEGIAQILRQAQNERKEGLNIMEKTHVATRLQPRDHDLKRSWLHWGIYKGRGLRMTESEGLAITDRNCRTLYGKN